MSTDTDQGDGDQPVADEVLGDFKSQAEQGPSIPIDINFDFIDQVSSQLYDNPRRAIEELVCNSYDAGATRCYVNTPGSSSEVLKVLDNGQSMNENGLEQLWKVADSPKKRMGGDRIDNNRQQIGKFGIGKLAAFALGRELTHIATVDGTSRVVTVAKQDLHGKGVEDPPYTNVFYMDSSDAQDFLDEHFSGIPNPWEEEWEHWTLAIVSDVKEEAIGRNLKAEYLERMLISAIPLSTNFTIYLNQDKLETRTPDSEKFVQMDIATERDFHEKLETELKSFWAEWDPGFADKEDVPEELYQCETINIPHYQEDLDEILALYVPELGPIYGEAAIYEDALTRGKREKRDLQDHGFRIKVRGKLLNRGDPLFDTDPKSHSYWNRFLAEVEVPELDEAILIQRDDVNETRLEPRLTREVLDRVFNYLRQKASKLEEEGEIDPGSFGHRFNTLSPFSAPKALEGLIDEGDFPDGGWEDIEVDTATLGPNSDSVIFDPEEQTIWINVDHPLFTAIDREKDIPNSLQKVIGEALAGQLISKGFLKASGVKEGLLEDSHKISETVLDVAAKYIEDKMGYHIRNLRQTSHDGDEPFEEAIVDAFRSMNFDAEHLGAVGEPDGVVSLSRPGDEPYRVSVEAKGSGESVDHKAAKIGNVRDHMNKENCDHAVIIARDFTLDGRRKDEDSNLLDQVGDYDDVSLLTVDALATMLERNREKGFTFDQMQQILQNEVHPDEQVGFVDEIWSQLPKHTGLMEKVLTVAYDIQDDEDVNQPSVDMILRDDRIKKTDVTDWGENGERITRDVKSKDVISILSFATTTGMVFIDDDARYYSIYQNPDQIISELSENRQMN